MSECLCGENHYKISWPLFLYFIKKEEEEYRHKILNLETGLFIKWKNFEKFEKVKIIKKDEKKVDKEKNDKVENNNSEIVELRMKILIAINIHDLNGKTILVDITVFL